jgi:hypothetical protein
MADDLRADLDQLFAQAGQRPSLRRFGHRQRSHEVAEVGESRELKTRSVGGDRRRTGAAWRDFTHPPHRIAPMDDHDLWMAFFKDPDGHTLAVMQEAPKGYKPGALK